MMMRSLVLTKLLPSRLLFGSSSCVQRPLRCVFFSTQSTVESSNAGPAGHVKKETTTTTTAAAGHPSTVVKPVDSSRVVKESCGDLNSNNDDDDEMEQEEMFVEAHESFEYRTLEWGGPRRGGRLPEPTRYGDWERKGRCSDF